MIHVTTIISIVHNDMKFIRRTINIELQYINTYTSTPPSLSSFSCCASEASPLNLYLPFQSLSARVPFMLAFNGTRQSFDDDHLFGSFVTFSHVLYEYRGKQIVLIITSPFNRLICLMLFTYYTSFTPCSIYFLNIRHNGLQMFFTGKIPRLYVFLHLCETLYSQQLFKLPSFQFRTRSFFMVSIAMYAICTHFSSWKEQHTIKWRKYKYSVSTYPITMLKPIQLHVLYIYSQYTVRILGLLWWSCIA